MSKPICHWSPLTLSEENRFLKDSRRDCCTWVPEWRGDGEWRDCSTHAAGREALYAAFPAIRDYAAGHDYAAGDSEARDAIGAALAVAGVGRLTNLPTDPERVRRFLDAHALQTTSSQSGTSPLSDGYHEATTWGTWCVMASKKWWLLLLPAVYLSAGVVALINPADAPPPPRPPAATVEVPPPVFRPLSAEEAARATEIHRQFCAAAEQQGYQTDECPLNPWDEVPYVPPNDGVAQNMDSP